YPTNDTDIEILYRVNNLSATYWSLVFGTNDKTNYFDFRTVPSGPHPASGIFRFHKGLYADSELTVPIDTAIHLLKLDGRTLYYDGVLVGSVPETTFQILRALMLFTSNGSGNTPFGQFTDMTIFYCKIWESGVLVNDFMPIAAGEKAPNNQTAPSNCFYEKVSQTFYQNARIGSPNSFIMDYA
ncbi:MAG: hypothetical protein LBU62_05160, partial [Bacteroidales bacterium]|nr:hypothetical protein [Bacteroidales bacterium]